jgi:hypothetical protein
MKRIKISFAIAFLFATALSTAHTLPATSSLQNEGMDIGLEGEYEPFFRRTGEKLYLNFFNSEMGDVQIKVIDSENRVVYSETLKSHLVVEKAFNFENAVKDSYKVIVKNGKETYSEYYVVK